MRLWTLALAVALCGGCGAQLSDGADPSLSGITTAPDAGPNGTTTTPMCTSRSVYLNFDGQTLTQGPSDATLNQASWMQIAQGTAPRYQDGNTNRDAAIQTIVDGVRAQLSQFPINVTTKRPTSGRYVMIVFGGDRTLVGSRFGVAVNQLDCGDTRPNDVAWISDGVSPTQRVINSAVGAIGFGLGLTATLDPRDCMCSWDNGCKPDNSAPCTLGSPIARDPTANQLCPDLTPEDEVAAIRTAFCN
ncbi:MAG TPA: hypothetical protein VF469_40590 [Kofleriaceae bacterium]